MSRRPDAAPRGPTQRQLKVGETLRRTLSDVLRRGDLHDPDLDRLSITVSEARMSSDLKVATVFVLPLGGAGEAEALAALDRHRPELRRLLARALRLKFAPDLRFLPDRSFDRMDDARRLLDSHEVRRDLDDAPDPAGRD